MKDTETVLNGLGAEIDRHLDQRGRWSFTSSVRS